MTILSEELFDLSASRLGEEMRGEVPWAVLDGLAARIMALGETLPARLYRRVGDMVWVARSAQVSKHATLGGPCIIGADCEVRRGAYIRGAALIGDGCVVGNSTEIKNAVLFDHVAAPHFNYIGDSVVGRGVHLGAGVILSNLRSDGKNVIIRTDPPQDTGRRKLGGLIGDDCELGCHAVINPGCVLGRGCVVYPLTSVTGVWRTDSRVRGGV